MFVSSILQALLQFVVLPPVVSALGTSCTTTLGVGNAGPGDPFWMQNIQHQGTAPYNADSSTYQVFRNVKDFGAKGDGVTDDTEAIDNAMTAGSRCGEGCASSTVSPAVVYFPQGTYLVSSSIIAYYYTQIIGDARSPPTVVASADFSGWAIIDADPYIPDGDGAQMYNGENNFYRSVRNLVLDSTRRAPSESALGIHWQVSQATSLVNLEIKMSTASGTAHQGLFIENGSGGFIGDVVFSGGNPAMEVGNQQFTVRNVTINDAGTAIYALWDWGWTFQNLNINDCELGILMTTNSTSQAVGLELIVDAVISNTPIFMQTTSAAVETASGSLTLGGEIYLNNVRLDNVPIAVGVQDGPTVLQGGTITIDSWAQGRVYSGADNTGRFVANSIDAPTKPNELLDSSGKIVGRAHPQYEDYAVSQFVSVKSHGAKGDGITDDTAAIQKVLDEYAGCKIILVDAGVYIITSTIMVPAGTFIVGEGWSVFMGSGAVFQDMSDPKPVFKIGNSGDQGNVQITDIVFTTRGPAAGAIVVEWNVHETDAAGAGLWDTHIRLGGATGTDIEASCGLNPSTTGDCFAAFLGLHLTAGSSAYIEGMWVWLADHDIDGTQSSMAAYSGRGILSESQGPVWLIGTASEHHVLYQYNLANAKNHYLGLIQTEIAYFQPSPAPPAPFSANSAYSDPSFVGTDHGWAVSIQHSDGILIFGAGLYSFFKDWNNSCSDSAPTDCQGALVSVDTASHISIYGLSTIGSLNQISYGGAGIIPGAGNLDGYQSTAIAWTV